MARSVHPCGAQQAGEEGRSRHRQEPCLCARQYAERRRQGPLFFTPSCLAPTTERLALSTARRLRGLCCSPVMISAGFVHLLGSAVEELNPGSLFPLAPFLCGLGFILTLIADFVGQRLACAATSLSLHQNTAAKGCLKSLMRFI